jgi:hypothetical protein
VRSTGSRRATLIASVSLTVLAVLALSVALAGTPPTRHKDGAGPLESTHGVFESMAIDAAAAGATAFTFGVPLCHAIDGPAPILRSIGPRETVGSGFAYLGSRIRTFAWVADHTGIGSVNGFPPEAYVAPDVLADPNGYAVETPCSSLPEQSYTELLLGLALTSPDGGGWRGILVTYEVGGQTRVLEIERAMLICGASVPDCD